MDTAPHRHQQSSRQPWLLRRPSTCTHPQSHSPPLRHANGPGWTPCPPQRQSGSPLTTRPKCNFSLFLSFARPTRESIDLPPLEASTTPPSAPDRTAFFLFAPCNPRRTHAFESTSRGRLALICRPKQPDPLGPATLDSWPTISHDRRKESKRPSSGKETRRDCFSARTKALDCYDYFDVGQFHVRRGLFSLALLPRAKDLFEAFSALSPFFIQHQLDQDDKQRRRRQPASPFVSRQARTRGTTPPKKTTMTTWKT